MNITVTIYGTAIGLALAIFLILKKITPAYAMILGAVVGGLVGGAGLVGTVQLMVSGAQSIIPSIVRIVTAGVLAGTLMESGAAERIADAIVGKLGSKRCLIAMMLATCILTAVGVFGDVSVITVAPIAIQMAEKAGYGKLGVLMAMIGGVKAGNVMSPNANTIAAAEAYHVPLTSVMLAGIVPAIAALITTTFLARSLAHKGTSFEATGEVTSKKDLPPLWAALSAPVIAVALLLLRPICNVTIDPLIALPLGGLVGIVAMKKTKDLRHYLNTGLSRMSGLTMLLIGTGTLSGIISNSNLKDVIITGIETVGLPGFMLAPIAGILMSAATASSAAATTLGGQIFGPTVMANGVAPLAGAAMTHAGSFVFDGLPHGPFFHVTAGTVNMDIRERLKLIVYESFNGLVMVAASTIVFGVLRVVQ